jgi:hypothetical protein
MIHHVKGVSRSISISEVYFDGKSGSERRKSLGTHPPFKPFEPVPI